MKTWPAFLIGAMVVTAHVQEPVFRAGTRIVPIYATVTGPDGRLLPNLVKDDFTVLDDGQPRPISVFSNQPTAIVGLAMWDVSPALDKNHLRARAAARALVDALWADDRLRFGTFSGQEFALSPLLTGDKAVLRRVVDEEVWFSDHGTPIWSALDRSLTSCVTRTRTPCAGHAERRKVHDRRGFEERSATKDAADRLHGLRHRPGRVRPDEGRSRSCRGERRRLCGAAHVVESRR